MRIPPKKLKILIIASIFLIAIFSRIAHSLAKEFWYDEAFTGILIQQPWKEMIRMIRSDIHPPLYYILLKTWSTVFGYEAFALRAFSIFANIAHLGIFYIFIKKYFSDKKFALIAAMLFAVNPFLIAYSAEARMYTLFAFLYFCAFYFFTKSIHEKKNIYWIFFSILYALCLYTHYMAILGILPFFIYAIFQKERLKNSIQCIFSLFGIFFLYYPWLTTFFAHFNKDKNGLYWIPEANIQSFAKTFFVFFFGLKSGVSGISQIQDYFFFSNNILSIFLIALHIIAFVIFFSRIKKFALTSSFFIFSYIAVFAVFAISKLKSLHIYNDRYLIIFAPFAIIFLWRILYKNMNKKIFFSIISAYILFLSFAKIPIQEKTYHGIAQYIISGDTQNSAIVITDANNFVIAKYYLGEKNEQRLKIFNKDNPSYDFASWVVINNSERILKENEIPQGSIILSSDKNFLSELSSPEKTKRFGDMYLTIFSP